MIFSAIPIFGLVIAAVIYIFIIWVLWMVVKSLKGIDASLKEIARNGPANSDSAMACWGYGKPGSANLHQAGIGTCSSAMRCSRRNLRGLRRAPVVDVTDLVDAADGAVGRAALFG